MGKCLISAVVELETPTLPNFLRVTGQKQMIPVEALDDDALLVLAAAWRDDLLEHARERRKRAEAAK